ncbi:hypothetical protein AWC38_SpisGene16565 [Stylophora pistillata]|uniref:Uncharacterized protein n=1 Tax=Stylophora pistillata TaxID=50429 RepID=A0A2B4RS26_STYPI|nr:hypothetical protein AWC38_SpisGene16565 [Stylophora pistillata]
MREMFSDMPFMYGMVAVVVGVAVSFVSVVVVGRQVRMKQGNQKDAHDYHAKERDLDTSDPVFVEDFSSPKSWQKGTVVSLTGPVSALVELQEGDIPSALEDLDKAIQLGKDRGAAAAQAYT